MIVPSLRLRHASVFSRTLLGSTFSASVHGAVNYFRSLARQCPANAYARTRRCTSLVVFHRAAVFACCPVGFRPARRCTLWRTPWLPRAFIPVATRMPKLSCLACPLFTLYQPVAYRCSHNFCNHLAGVARRKPACRVFNTFFSFDNTDRPDLGGLSVDCFTACPHSHRAGRRLIQWHTGAAKDGTASKAQGGDFALSETAEQAADTSQALSWAHGTRLKHETDNSRAAFY